MGKHFNFKVGWQFLAHFCNSGQGHFAGAHDTLGAKLIPGQRGLRVGNTRLGRHVNVHLRGFFLGQRKSSQVANNKGVHTCLRKGADVYRQVGKVVFVHLRVNCYMNLYATLVRICNNLRHFVKLKVVGARTHAEAIGAQINGVRTKANSELELFPAPCRC